MCLYAFVLNISSLLTTRICVIVTIFILGSSLTLPAVREVSLLNFELFEAELTLYSDRAKPNFVLQGIKEGFRLGCDKPVTLRSARKNKLSAYQHSGVIDAYLANEVRLGRVAGPFDAPPMQDIHVSSFGVIPKKGSQTNGALSWTYPHRMATVSTMESILNLGISSTSKWMTLSRLFLNLGRVPSSLNLTLSLHSGILPFILWTGIYWA